MTNLATAYLTLKQRVLESGYADEIGWQESCDVERVDEQVFLTETAFVILNSGMRASVVRAKWPEIREGFLEFVDAKTVLHYREDCRREALTHFRNQPKIDAIIRAAEIVDELGFETIHERLKANDREFLLRFPFIGPITSYHLAKNMGMPVAKPDRHLVRYCDAAGFPDVQTFCQAVAEAANDTVPVVDIVLWRYATLDTNYLQTWKGLLEGHEMTYKPAAEVELEKIEALQQQIRVALTEQFAGRQINEAQLEAIRSMTARLLQEGIDRGAVVEGVRCEEIHIDPMNPTCVEIRIDPPGWIRRYFEERNRDGLR